MISNKRVSPTGQEAFASKGQPVLAKGPARSWLRNRTVQPRSSLARASGRREQLVRLLDELRSELEHCQAELRKDGGAFLEADDSAERASHIVLAGTINHLAARVREVERALDRIGGGSYGRCTDCGQRIAQSRLKANPTAQRCLRCQVAFERPHRRLPFAG